MIEIWKTFPIWYRNVIMALMIIVLLSVFFASIVLIIDFIIGWK